MKKKRIIALVAVTLSLVLGLPVCAEEAHNDLQMQIGGSMVDLEELAEANNVDPYELKSAIEESMGDEKVSPFSSLKQTVLNTDASEYIDYGMARAGGNVKIYKTNQDSTGYVAKSGAQTASGKTPTLGMCSMQIKSTTKTGTTTDTIVRLGTTIHMTSAVNVNGQNLTSFVVEDRGDPGNRTNFWIDIYFGDYVDKSSQTYKAAIEYGLKKVSYYYYY